LPSQPLDYCRWKVPNGKEVAFFSLKDGKAFKNALNAVYLGRGLAAGDCGMTIPVVTDANNGELECGLSYEGTENIGKIKVVVASKGDVLIKTAICWRKLVYTLCKQ